MPRKAAAPAPAPEPRDIPTDYHDDRWVEIFPPSGLHGDYARALLAAAERIGYDPGRAVVSISGAFRVPDDVAAATDFPDVPTSTGHQATPTPLAALDLGAVPDPPDDGS